jgi:chromosome partitioning protein
MLTIAVTNTKGGVGKTTLVASLGVRAAQDKFKGGAPYRVALVDLDPMKGLVAWWLRRGKTENPTIFEGAETAADAVERLEMDGWDVCIMDSPPAFLTVIDEMIRVADFTVIPTKASMLDIMGMGDMLTLANEARAAHFVVFNDIAGPEKTLASARKMLAGEKIPTAKTHISHRPSHVAGMAAGKTAAEINKGRDATASAEIDQLWLEVKAAAVKAAKNKGTNQ